MTSRHFVAVLAVGLTLSRAPLSAQSNDPLTLLPDNYRLQFENDWVRLVRARVAGNSRLPLHAHPAGLIVYLYLSDSGPMQFNHEEFPGKITRRPVTARSYRVGRATPENHEVINSSDVASDWLRIELKTSGTDSPRQRVTAPPLKTSNDVSVEVTSDSLRLTRLTVGAGQAMEIATAASNPTLLVALTSGQLSWGDTGVSVAPGQERFIAAGQRVSVRNSAPTAIELLRVDFLAPRP